MTPGERTSPYETWARHLDAQIRHATGAHTRGSMVVEIKGYHITAGCNRREHWRTAARVKRQQRDMVAKALWAEQMLHERAIPALPVKVTFTRVAPRALDDDNLSNAFKHVRDECAVWLGLPNDSDPRVTWACLQRKGAPGQYGIEISIETRAA